MLPEENNNTETNNQNLDTMMQDAIKLFDNPETIIEEWKKLTKKYVRKMRLIPVTDHDFNSFPFMSKIIVEEIFMYAQDHPDEEVKMFIGDVKSDFYGDNWLFDKISSLSDEGIKFNIVLAKPPNMKDNDKWQSLKKRFSGNVTVKTKPQYDEELHHLILVGDAYRYEDPHKYYEGEVTDLSPLRPARFAFHDEYYVKKEVLEHWKTQVNSDLQELLPI